MSELREAIARAIGAYLEEKGFSYVGGVGFDTTDDFCLGIDTNEVADAALAAIEAQGVRLVWMKPVLLPGPQILSETTITITEPTTLTLQMGQPGGAGGGLDNPPAGK